jgi:hypothetical protein
MLAPVFVGYGGKPFTDCITYNNGGTTLTSYYDANMVVAYPGYTFQQGDVAIAATTRGTYPTQSGWSRIVDASNTDLWIKTLGASDNFNSTWLNPANDSTLFYSGVSILVFRSPYRADAIVYANNENLYSTTVNSTGPHTIPAVSRSSFDDSAFYYRLDVVHATESWGSYYNNSFYYSTANLLPYSATTTSSNCANTYVFFTSPGEALGFAGWDSPNLSGSTAEYYCIGNSNNTIYYRTTTLWLRGFTQSQSGVML